MKKVNRVIAILSCLVVATAVIADDNNATQDGKPDPMDQEKLFERVNLHEAWEITKGDPNVLVGVIDNGFDFFHPDLKGQLIPGYYFAGGFHTEFYANIAHGTMVSSLIVAKDNDKAMVA